MDEILLKPYKDLVKNLPFNPHSLLFAPMEGVTDEPYRLSIHKLFNDWDYYSTDFYRVPTVGKVNKKTILRHYGHKANENKNLKKKTSYQILTSARAQTSEVVEYIDELGFEHLDLNLGCPSKKVNAHHGGAYLLQDLDTLRRIIREIRSRFNKTFTVKIRIGYHDDSLFDDLLMLFEDEGVEAITIHARTRDQLYQGVADWSYIKRAVEKSNLPIIGNGDVWTPMDAKKMFDECNPYAIMIGRGALKTPWLASIYHQHKDNLDFLSDEYILKLRTEYLKDYFDQLKTEYVKNGLDSNGVLKRFKSYSRYLFDDYENADSLKSSLLRSSELGYFEEIIEKL